jgi:hypothetical protein
LENLNHMATRAGRLGVGGGQRMAETRGVGVKMTVDYENVFSHSNFRLPSRCGTVSRPDIQTPARNDQSSGRFFLSNGMDDGPEAAQ